MHASLCVCVRVYQVRMFTPDKIKYADQLYGVAEVQQDLELRQQNLFEDYVSSGYVSPDLVAGVCVCVWRSACRHACGRAVFSLSPPQPLPASLVFNFLCVQNSFLHSIIDVFAFRLADAQPSHTHTRAVRGHANTESKTHAHIHAHTHACTIQIRLVQKRLRRTRRRAIWSTRTLAITRLPFTLSASFYTHLLESTCKSFMFLWICVFAYIYMYIYARKHRTYSYTCIMYMIQYRPVID